MNENTRTPFDEENSFIDFHTLLNLLIGKWYLFVGSALLCVLLGCVYIYRTPKVYQKSATLLVKEMSRYGNGVASQASAFADIAGVNLMSMSFTENELLLLQSRSLMRQVVNRLGLHITYYDHRLFRMVELYEQTPLRLVESRPGTLLPAALELTPLTAQTCRIEMSLYDEKTDESRDTVFTAPFNRACEFPFGEATIQTAPERLEAYLNRPISIYINSPKRVASALLGSVNVSRVSKEASMIEVTVRSSRPGKAEDIVNTLLDQYEQDAIDDKNRVLDNTTAFIAERRVTIKQELNDVDTRIENYKRSTLSTNLSNESQVYLQSATSLEEKIYANRIQSSLTDILADYMTNPLHKDDLLPYNIGLENQSLNAQIQLYNDNRLRFNRMLTASSESNPVVEDMRASLEASRASIEKTVGEMQRSLRLQAQQLESRNKMATGRIESVSTNERNVQSITRDQKIKSELYLYLLNKSEENAIVRSTTEANARLVDSAFGPDYPVSPRRMIILLASLLIGLALPAAWFIGKEMLNTKVRGRSDVAKVVHAPILGEIPDRSDAYNDLSSALLVRAGSGSQISEAFRILRTNLAFLNVGQRNRVFAFTSSRPGEGKTFVTMNFAMTLALAGKRVCLVDLDLRRCSLSKAMHLKGHRGVTDFLVGKVTDCAGLIHPTEHSDCLSIVPSGTIPPNPAELLMGARFDELINELLTRFDYLFLDNPPVQSVADATIANRVSDLTFYIVRAGFIDRRELESVETIYQEHSLRNMTVIVNGVDYEELYYSMGYHGYGKRYGYGRYDEQKSEVY